MTTVRFLGWSQGLNKVQLTKLLRESANVPLNEAHEAVNRLLSGEIIEFQVQSQQAAQRLAHAACNLGAQAECVPLKKTASR